MYWLCLFARSLLQLFDCLRGEILFARFYTNTGRHVLDDDEPAVDLKRIDYVLID